MVEPNTLSNQAEPNTLTALKLRMAPVPRSGPAWSRVGLFAIAAIVALVLLLRLVQP